MVRKEPSRGCNLIRVDGPTTPTVNQLRRDNRVRHSRSRLGEFGGNTRGFEEGRHMPKRLAGNKLSRIVESLVLFHCRNGDRARNAHARPSLGLEWLELVPV